MDYDNNKLNLGELDFKELFSHITQSDHLDSVLQAVADGITVQDKLGRLVYANDAAAKVMGFASQSELLSTSLAEIMNNFELYDELGHKFSMEDLPGRKALAGENCTAVIVRWVAKKTKKERWAQIKATPIRDTAGNVIFAVNIFHDLTEQKQIEENLSKINRRNKHILESITDGFYALDLDLNFTYVNKQAEPYFGGVKSEDAIGRNIWEVFPQAITNMTMFYHKVEEASRSKETIHFEEYYPTLSVWLEFSIYPARDGLALYFRDVTESKAVDETNKKLAAIVSSSEDAIIGKNLDGIITSWNRGAESIYGFTPEEMIGQDISTLVPPDFLDDTVYILENIKQGKSLEHYETKRRTKDGRVLDVSITISPIHNYVGEIIGASAVARDITELKLTADAQEFLSQASTLLSSSLDYQTTLIRVAKLAVPKFGDWCSIQLLTPDGEIESVAVEHTDPERVKLAKEFAVKYPTEKNTSGGVNTVIQTGKSQFVSQVTDELIRQTAVDQEQYEILKQLGLNSVMIVPLTARQKTIGAITFIWSESYKNYTQRDLQFAEELGRRAGVAVDNAVLFKTVLAEIEERTRISQELQVSEERYRSLMAATTSIIWITDPQGKFIVEQSSWQEYTGQLPNEYQGYGWINAIHPDDRAQILAEWKAAVGSRGSYESTGRLWNFKLKQYRHFIARSIPLLGSDGTIREWIGSINDVDDRKRAEDQLKYQFHHDYLTDLPNRTYLNEQVTKALADAKTTNQVVALLLIDLDRFKNINESLGHAIGDRLIQEVALRIQSCIKDEFVVARLGGDEFGILMPNIEKEDRAAQMANAILAEFRPAFILDKHELYVSPSIGVSLFPYDGREASELFRNAETALYRAKEQGRNTYQFYTSSLNATSFEKLNLESKLRRAIENEEFVLFYQPQIDVVSGKVVGAEALIRWQRPDLTLILPDQFIPLAEANGLIETIGLWTLKQGLAQAKLWHDRGHKIMISINLSPRQFKQKQFDQILINSIEESGLDPKYVELELTESVFAENTENVVHIMNELRSRGVKFCLDDFSTGYSSLKYIKQFPVDMLKIERNFIKGIPHDVQNCAIAKSIITLGQSLGMEVTAEGVESKKQLAFLRSNSCNRAQGYLFNGAMPGDSLTEILSEERYVSVINSLNKDNI